MEPVQQEIYIPKREGRAVEVHKGQLLRVITSEGKQVGDMAVFNLHDPREAFSGPSTAAMNDRSFRRADRLYSGPPYFDVLMSVADDPYGVHWFIGGRCSPLTKGRDGNGNAPNCHSNLVSAVAPWGISEYQVPLDTFVLFMYVDVDADCRYSYRPPLMQQGDHIDLRAEKDLLVAISACPSERVINDGMPKGLTIEVREAESV